MSFTHKFYADESFPNDVVKFLRGAGYDIITALEDQRANLQIPDDKVLERAVELGRRVLTRDKDFKRLHYVSSAHLGIIFCTADPDFEGQARRIVDECSIHEDLNGILLKIYRPSK